MLVLDPLAREQYDAIPTTEGRGVALLGLYNDAQEPAVIRVLDGADTVRGSGVMQSPWATLDGTEVVLGEVESFEVTDGGTPDAGWRLRLEANGYWMEGSFGLLASGADFTWSLATFETGQFGALGTVVLVPKGIDPVIVDLEPAWNALGNVYAEQAFVWDVAAAVVVPLRVVNPPPEINLRPGESYSIAQHFTGGLAPITYDYVGTLAPGLSLNTATGLLSASQAATVSSETVSFGANDATPSGSGIETLNPPTRIELNAGESYDLSQHFTGGSDVHLYSKSGALPAAVTFGTDGFLTAGAAVVIGASASVTFSASDLIPVVLEPLAVDLDADYSILSSVPQPVFTDLAPRYHILSGVAPAPGEITTFGVLSDTGGTDLHFAFGHPFKQGDVPAGAFVDTSLTDWQCSPTTYWPDGSVRHAVIAGRASCVAGVTTFIGLRRSTTARSGTVLTEGDLADLAPSVTVTAGSQVINLADLIGTSALHRTVCAGPVMSNWIYRVPITGSAHLVAFIDVRLFKDGTLEIFPYIENGYLYVPSPINDVRTWTVTIDGAVKYTASLDIKHHTRVALLDNTLSTFKHWSYWTGTDPRIEPQHNGAYLQASKMVPNYGFTPYQSTLNNLRDGFKPGDIGDTYGYMGTPGHLGYVGIIPPWAAAYVASGCDVRGFRSVIANGFASGSWPIHFRDEKTNEPLRFSQYPTIWSSSGVTPVPPIGSGGFNSGNGGPAEPDTAHQPSLAYVPWLVTGRYFFVDEVLLWMTWSYIQCNYVERQREKYLQFMSQTRARARLLRTLAQALAIMPANHPCFPDVQNAWEQNMIGYKARYVDGTIHSGRWKNDLGWMGHYSSGSGSPYFNTTNAGYWWDAPWMMLNIVCAIGHAWDLNLPQSDTARAAHLEVRDFGYRIPVGLSGDPNDPNAVDYRRSCYELPIGTDNSGIPVENWLTYAGMRTAIENYGNYGTPFAPLPVGDTRITYRGVPISGDHWSSHSAKCYHFAALAMAVEAGTPGAQAGWDRLLASASWAAAPAAFRAAPAWGFWPRAPEVAQTLPAQGDALLVAAAESYQVVKPPIKTDEQFRGSLFESYGSGLYNPYYSEHGAFIICGTGGHNHQETFGGVVWDWTTRAWSWIPAVGIAERNTPVQLDETNGQPWLEMPGTEIPAPSHPFRTQAILPPEIGGDPKGSILYVGRGSVANSWDPTGQDPVSWSYMSSSVHRFDLSTGQWRRALSTLLPEHPTEFIEANTIFDPVTKRFYTLRRLDYFTRIGYVDMATTPWAYRTSAAFTAKGTAGQAYMTAIYAAVNGKRLILTVWGQLFQAIDLDNIAAGWKSLAYTGGMPVTISGGNDGGSQNCWVHHLDQNVFYYRHHQAAGQQLWKMVPPADPLNGTWVVSKITLGGDAIPEHATPDKPWVVGYRSLMYIPSLRMLGWVTKNGVALLNP